MSATNLTIISMAAFRHALLCILTFVFAWQTIQSFNIFLSRGTTFSERTLMEFKQDFPDVSLCPTAFGEDRLDTVNLTFQEELDLATIPFDLKYSQASIGHAAKITERNLDQFWNITVAYDFYSKRLKKCFTYSPGHQITNGYDSLFSVFINGENIPDIFVFLEPPNDNLLVPVKNLRREFFLLPRGKHGNRQISYEIHHRKVKLISKDQLPCQEDQDVRENHQGCIESYIERQAGCLLPWRMGKTFDAQKACTNTTIYKNMLDNLTMLSDYNIYIMTGCQFPCKFMDYTSVQLLDRLVDGDTNSSLQTHQLFFYLTAGGGSFHEEVYVYNFLDFVGNVGGFLGLLLGASLLSIYDGAIEGFKRCQSHCFNRL